MRGTPSDSGQALFSRSLESFLAGLGSDGLLRTHRPVTATDGRTVRLSDGRTLVSFASNDYLGLGAMPLTVSSDRSSSSASRLLGGSLAELHRAEEFLADFFGYPEAVLFPSGFQANVALVMALSRMGLVIVADRQDHASVKTGLRASGARFHLVNHLSSSHLEKRLASLGSAGAAVFTEGLFSMSGKSPDSAQLIEITDKFGTILISDEAHALGVLGPEGRGVLTGSAHIVVGTFGKAYGLWGAFILGPVGLHDLMANGAFPYVYTTAPPPVLAALVPERVSHAAQMDGERDRLLHLARRFRQALSDAGVSPENVSGNHHITFVTVGPRATEVSALLEERGLWVPAVRPPTVPVAGLRISLTAMHTEDDAERLASTLAIVL